MDGDIDLNLVPLSRLSDESMQLLSSLLNPKKVIKTVCPDRISRYRDWRGLASLVNISSQIEASIKEYSDKVGKVIEIWINNDSEATIGQLLFYLQQLDRFDVHDDLLDLIRTNKLLESPSCQQMAVADSPEDNQLTFDDVRFNRPQYYHAYVLYAPQDRGFVDLMIEILGREGLKVCTEDDLLPGFSTRIQPVVRMISERCRRIILVYSPDFFQSSATLYSTQFAQAHGIEMRNRNLIPIMYRPCTVPANLTYYQHLMYPQPLDGKSFTDKFFWRKLVNSVTPVTHNRFTNGSMHSESSFFNIQSMPAITNGYSQSKPSTSYALVKVETPPDSSRFIQDSSSFIPENEKVPLALPDIPKIEISNSTISLPSSLHSDVSDSASDNEVKEPKSTTDISKEGKGKKTNRVMKFFGLLPRKMNRKKKALEVAN
ncbi:myeloid differentiation primary response protein MyD88-A [Epargyreus clarus]|uniref:myeloid differentiation primary response protein MyD88-A n=1 Tax=Epargyreus clarus TaxID=520877 RepID=UPI003C2F2EB9